MHHLFLGRSGVFTQLCIKKYVLCVEGMNVYKFNKMISRLGLTEFDQRNVKWNNKPSGYS